jgi:site-specific DNA-methyltransferase (adenine-specific)
MAVNQLYYGDCLTVIEKDIELESVDLVYLDPPFNSNRAYNAIYKDETGRPLPDQIEAFCDLWTLDEERERAIRNLPALMKDKGIDHNIVKFWESWLAALRYTNPKLLAYLSYMAERLLYMKDVLKPTSSIYLHCDPTASHYIKVMMDGVFGYENFRNEIVWQRTITRKGNLTRGLARDTDIILRYSKSGIFTWNSQAVTIPYDLSNLDPKTKAKYSNVDKDGRLYQLTAITAPVQNSKSSLTYEVMGVVRTWRWTKERMEQEIANGRVVQTKQGNVPRQIRYLDEQTGKTLNNVWTDIPALNSQAKERLGYPTQKPLALIERIIKASSNEGDVILDPFCGCATTLEASEKLNRKWIGIDIAIHAINKVVAVRLKDRCKLIEGKHYQITGIPRTLEGAIDLWERDRYHFQKWAVEEVEGFVTTRRSADGGIDGRLYFSVPDERDLQSMILEVKGGANGTINALRALCGVLEQDDALLAGLIVMNPLGDRQARNFRQFMAEAGDLRVDDTLYPRLQMLSIPELLDGKRFKTPTVKARGSGQILIAL